MQCGYPKQHPQTPSSLSLNFFYEPIVLGSGALCLAAKNEDLLLCGDRVHLLDLKSGLNEPGVPLKRTAKDVGSVASVSVGFSFFLA